MGFNSGFKGLSQATESSIRMVGLQTEIRSGELSITTPFGERLILKIIFDK